MQWTLLAEAGADDVRLLAGLAFIHREWWCYRSNCFPTHAPIPQLDRKATHEG